MTTTKLGWEQAIKNSYDEPTSSLRTSISNLEIAVELSADDGDSVITVPKAISVYASLSSPQAAGNIAIPATKVEFCNSVSIMISNPDGSTQFTIEVSPSDTLEVWHQISSHNATSGISHHEPTFFPCRRLRVKFGTSYSNSSPILVWLNGRA